MFSSISFRFVNCHRLIGSIRLKSTSKFIPTQKCSFFVSNSSFSNKNLILSSQILSRNFFKSSALLNSKVSAPKRGPKFRTPSKMKENIEEIFDDEKGKLDWNIWAYATADEYKMDSLSLSLKMDSDYEVNKIDNDLPDVFRLTPVSKKKDLLETDRREIFVFNTGTVVFWDVPIDERRDFLHHLGSFERRPFDKDLVEEECERLIYVLHNHASEEIEAKKTSAVAGVKESTAVGIKSGKFSKEILHLDAAGQDSKEQLLERYTVSNVMSDSVQLSMWESDFENLASTLDEVTEAMNKGKISLHKKRAISYAGRLTSLRHNVSLHSDLLDHPDFYWERVGLEKLYDQASEILCIRRRVRVFNKKLDDAMALIQIIMQELACMHSARLEWLIIYLIMVEVVFDAYHLWRTW